MTFRMTAVVAAFALGTPSMAMADGTQVVGGDVTAGGGFLSVTEDFDDRFFGFTGGNVFFEGGLGLHSEIVFEEREETGGLFIGGASYNTPRFQIKGLAGTSSNVEDILPELFLRGEVTYRTNPDLGVVVTGAVTHRDYRNDASEIVFDAALTKYFPLHDNKSIIVQALGAVGENDPGDTSFSGGGAIAFSAYREYTVGLKVTGGDSSYDSVLGAGNVDNEFIVVQPNASIFLADNFEMFGRLEYGDTDIYDYYGGALGFKVLFTGDDF